MACCGKGKNAKKPEIEGLHYAPKEGSGVAIKVNYVNVNTGELAYKEDFAIDTVRLSNIFRMIYTTKEHGYKKTAKRILFPVFPKGSKFGLCENLCVTKDNPTLTVDKNGKLIPFPKEENKVASKEKPPEIKDMA